MSKIGNWVLEMQEDAEWMSRDVFIRKHGIAQSSFFDECQEEPSEPDLEAMKEGFYGS